MTLIYLNWNSCPTMQLIFESWNCSHFRSHDETHQRQSYTQVHTSAHKCTHTHVQIIIGFFRHRFLLFTFHCLFSESSKTKHTHTHTQTTFICTHALCFQFQVTGHTIPFMFSCLILFIRHATDYNHRYLFECSSISLSFYFYIILMNRENDVIHILGH